MKNYCTDYENSTRNANAGLFSRFCSYIRKNQAEVTSSTFGNIFVLHASGSIYDTSRSNGKA